MSEVDLTPVKRTRRLKAGEKLRSADKVERIPVKVLPTETVQKKPDWLRIRIRPSKEVERINKRDLRLCSQAA